MSAIHVRPVGDLIDHDTATSEADCVCGPLTEAEFRDDGSVAWIIIHNSLDGRECNDPGGN